MIAETPEPAGRRPVREGEVEPGPWSRWPLLVWTVAGIVLVVAVFSGTVDARARSYSDAVLARAFTTFAAARALDAAISLAQGTEIALQPAGVGLTVSAGEILDPINDLVEQFASVMLVSSASLGLQSLLLRASGWWLFGGLLVVATLARLVAAWLPAALPAGARRTVHVVFVVALLLRLAVPTFVLGSSWIFETFLSPSQEESVRMLEEAGQDIRDLEQLDEDAEELEEAGWLERATAWFAQTVEQARVEERITAFRDRVGQAVEHVVHLIVVFTLQTVLLPLAFLWLLPRVAGLAFDRLR